MPTPARPTPKGRPSAPVAESHAPPESTRPGVAWTGFFMGSAAVAHARQWRLYSLRAAAMTTSPQDDLLLHARDERGVHRLTLHAPRSFNVLSEEMLTALQLAIDAVAADPQARAVVIAAEGKAFCAGHDLKQMRAHPDIDYYRG
ncbi:enoyl-CoA hydratase/isomerase family protein, partial [Arthrospira platensis SPKY1]|nr:enoyl-CoA hydratase/isomerase family protein [Arthrospira platensis SPKY1]